jgi:hypothetical protein
MSTRIRIHLKIFHTDYKDLKDGYAIRYAVEDAH